MGKSYTNTIVTSRNFRSKQNIATTSHPICTDMYSFTEIRPGDPRMNFPFFLFSRHTIVAVMPLADTFIIDFNPYYKRTLDYLISIFFATDVEHIHYNKTHKMHIPYGKV